MTQNQEALTATIKQLTKKYGQGIVMRLGEHLLSHIPTFSTGSLSLDLALGGGLPQGRVVEYFGPEASGKTTMGLCAIAQVQQAGGTAALIDSEHAFDRQYAKALGVVTNDLLVTQPDDGEQALDVAEQLIKSTAVKLVVIDSVAALVPRSELEGAMGAHNVGGQARLMSHALRRLAGVINKTGATCIFINQLREKIGITFGNPEVTSGGRALKFYASVRLDIRRASFIKESTDKVVGHRIRVKVVKNKVAPPFRIASFNLRYGQGIDTLNEVIDLSLSLGLIQQAGSWYTYQEQKLGQGKGSIVQWLTANLGKVKVLTASIKQEVEQRTLAPTK